MASTSLLSLVIVSTALAAPQPAEATPPPATDALQCSLHARTQRDGHWLEFQLRNPGAAPVWVLTWGSPFEGAWMAPFVTVTRDGQALPYQGAKAKRGEPERGEYLRLAAGQKRSVRLRLDDAFTLDGQGPWHVRAHWHWHDWVQGSPSTLPRPREQHQGRDQACGSIEVR